jgi:hypothetical protein
MIFRLPSLGFKGIEIMDGMSYKCKVLGARITLFNWHHVIDNTKISQHIVPISFGKPQFWVADLTYKFSRSQEFF